METEIRSHAKKLIEAQKELALLESRLEYMRRTLDRLKAEEANLGRSTTLTREIQETKSAIRTLSEKVGSLQYLVQKLSRELN